MQTPWVDFWRRPWDQKLLMATPQATGVNQSLAGKGPVKPCGLWRMRSLAV